MAAAGAWGSPDPLANPLALSIWGLFMQAGFVVKVVMIGLLAASVWTWAIIVDKWMRFSRFRRQLNSFENNFWSGQSLEELYRALSAKPKRSVEEMLTEDVEVLSDGGGKVSAARTVITLFSTSNQNGAPSEMANAVMRNPKKPHENGRPTRYATFRPSEAAFWPCSTTPMACRELSG